MTLNKEQLHMLEEALLYATERNWHILPVSKIKKPLIKEWTKNASNDEKQIVKWWKQYPNANIGVLTGPESGFWVLDMDSKEDYNGVEVVANHFGDKFVFDVDNHLLGKTPTGGLHMLFQWDDNFPVKTCSGILKGVDIRGIGGQIVVAPSYRYIDHKKIEYYWNNKENSISPNYDWTYELINMGARKDEHGKLDLNKVLIEGTSEGERDESLNRLAWLFRGRNISFEHACVLVELAASKCKPPFDKTLARQKVEHAYRTPAAKITKWMEAVTVLFDLYNHIHPKSDDGISTDNDSFRRSIEGLKHVSSFHRTEKRH